MPCLDPDTAMDYLAGSIPQEAARIERHLDECEPCRTWIAELARTSLITAADHHEPDDDAIPLGEYLPPGTPVGRYVLGDKLGEGGMGVVYEATDPALERRLAIKVLRVAIATASTGRLVAEARAMAKLSHPNVREIYDLGEVGKRPFLAMELMQGQTLQQWLRASSRSTPEIIRAFIDAGRGLAAAHSIGIVHRDFKPANVFVEEDGRVVVSDFGLSTSLHEDTLARGGTPRYMAPEQHHGRGDTRADQYAFGVVLQEALGERSVPRRVGAALQRAVERDPEHRYRSMAELLGQLDGRGWRRRGPMLGAAAGVLGLVGVAMVLPSSASSVVTPPQGEPEAKAPPRMDKDVHTLHERVFELDESGRFEEALAVAEEAVARATATEDEPGRALALRTRAHILERLGRYEEADDDLEQAYPLAMAVGREDLALSVALDRISVLTSDLGRSEEAIRWGRHAQATLARAEVDVRDHMQFETVLALELASSGDFAQAKRMTRSAVSRARRLDPPDPWALAVALSNLGHFELMDGEPAASMTSLTEALAIATEKFGPGHTEVAKIQVNLANTHKSRGELEPALALYEAALKTFEQELGPDHPNVATLLTNLGGIRVDAGEPEAALAPLRRSIEIYGDEHPSVVHGYHNLGIALSRLHRCTEAIEEFERSLEVLEQIQGPDRPTPHASLVAMAECQLALGNPRAALEAATQASGLPGPYDPGAERSLPEVLRKAREALEAG